MSMLATLSKRELAFVAAYARFGVEAGNPCDEDLAVLLGCTRRTIINRRNRLRAKGVPLFPFRARGFEDSHRTISVDELTRKAERMRRRAADSLRQADRLEDQARELVGAHTALGGNHA